MLFLEASQSAVSQCYIGLCYRSVHRSVLGRQRWTWTARQKPEFFAASGVSEGTTYSETRSNDYTQEPDWSRFSLGQIRISTVVSYLLDLRQNFDAVVCIPPDTK